MIPITEIHPILVHFPIVLWISAEAIAVVVLIRGGELVYHMGINVVVH